MENEIYLRRSAGESKSCLDLFLSGEKIFCNVRFLGRVYLFKKIMVSTQIYGGTNWVLGAQKGTRESH